MKILIIKMSSFGDVIHCIPSLCALKKGFDPVEIDWLIDKQYEELLQGHPYINRLVSIDRDGIKKGFLEGGRAFSNIKEFLENLRDREYDIIVDFQGLLKSGIMMALSRGRRKIGFDSVREMAGIFYNEKVPLSTLNQHAVTRYLEIPKYLGLDVTQPEFFLHISSQEEKEACDLLNKIGLNSENRRKRIFINPNCRWDSKRWPWEYFLILIRLLKERGMEILLIGSPSDWESMNNVFSGLGERVYNIAGCLSLKGLAAILKKGDCLVTNDSGPMHLAVAVNLPVVSLFGPTNPLRTGPFITPLSKNRVLTSDERCSPCYKRHCRRNSCMRNISVDKVLDAIEEII